MPDILVRDVPDDVVAALDAAARRSGLSRSEWVRRKLAQEVEAVTPAVTVADLQRVAEAFADALDPEVMAAAWR